MDELNRFVADYCNKHFLRLHVPGHQGRCGFLNRRLAALYDITEIEGADWLLKSSGIIKTLEQRLSSLFNQESIISTCGSTLCVQTMVALCKNRVFVAFRKSAHLSFFNVCAVLNVRVEWVGGPDFGNDELNEVDLVELEQILKKYEYGSCAVYVTSPNYYGVFAPVSDVANICKKFGALLLVDCAHGAHLNFVDDSKNSPAMLGAHMCCYSLHKTLPALTGSAILSFDSAVFSVFEVKQKMALFSTTSPSYLIMQSIEFCARWLKKNGIRCFEKLKNKKRSFVDVVKFPFLKFNDVSKLVADCRQINLSGFEVARILRASGIEPEFANENFVVLVISPFLSCFDWQRLRRCFEKIKFSHVKCERPMFSAPKNKLGVRTISLSEAVFSELETEVLGLGEVVVGRVSAVSIEGSVCGTLMVAIGEPLSFEVVSALKTQGYGSIEVFK